VKADYGNVLCVSRSDAPSFFVVNNLVGGPDEPDVQTLLKVAESVSVA
jgi:hypothetical protein